ncbi:MAG TPA: CU044_5270 family protein, partial [Thermomonospora sp.]|nr:CU044_5270 family protein [Thermomonospora sp.]
MWARGLVGAAAATALAVAVTTAVSGGDGGGDGAPTDLTSARAVLLAAADRAETAPGDGRYWRVTVTTGDARRVHADWITRDGQRWVGHHSADGDGPRSGLHKLKGLRPEPVTVLGPDPGLKALMALPASPAALRSLAERHAPADSPHQTKRGYVVDAFVELLTRHPVPPKVRAAAYRALADLPGVRSLGEIRDARGRKGVALSFTDRSPRLGTKETRLIIDPRTSQVLSTAFVSSRKGRSGPVLYLGAVWTNDPPAVPGLP